MQVDNNRPYAYLTAGLPVKRGDRVRVPYGKKNEPKKGVVRSVGDYIRDTAPWPPEKTKRVLEILPKPQKYAWDLSFYSEQGAALQAELAARLQETLYEKAISLLHKGDAYAARDCLQEYGDYKDAATILA